MIKDHNICDQVLLYRMVLTAAVIPATPAPMIATFVLLHVFLLMSFVLNAGAAMIPSGRRLAARSSTLFISMAQNIRRRGQCNTVGSRSDKVLVHLDQRPLRF